MIRVYEKPAPGRRYRLRPGAYVILLRGRDLLLTHQCDPEPEFQLPGGGIDPGETSIAALHREVFEETGWRIGRPKRLGAYRRFVYMPEYDLWAEKLCHVFLARPVLRLGPPAEEGHSAVWTSLALAPALLADTGARDFVAGVIGQSRAPRRLQAPCKIFAKTLHPRAAQSVSPYSSRTAEISS